MSHLRRFYAGALIQNVVVTRGLPSSSYNAGFRSNVSLLLVNNNNKQRSSLLNLIPAATIVSVAKQDESFQRPAPFPYKERTFYKIYKWFEFLDPTLIRMNANSKIIVVDGNMGSGKSKVAAKLAEAFDWYHMPEPRMDMYYINDYGFDYRSLNKYLTERTQIVDEKMFFENPKHLSVPRFKTWNYRIRYHQYIDALMHLFNTGQGVILERSPFSDCVFTEAMYENGYMPKDGIFC